MDVMDHQVASAEGFMGRICRTVGCCFSQTYERSTTQFAAVTTVLGEGHLAEGSWMQMT